MQRLPRISYSAHCLLLALSLVFALATVADEEKVPGPPPTADELALRQVARALTANDWAKAADQARLLTEETKPAKIRLAALERLATALAGLGEPKESEQVAQQVELLFREQDRRRLAKSSAHLRNRSAYDGVRRYAVALLRKRQAAAGSAGPGENSGVLWRSGRSATILLRSPILGGRSGG